ncbi:excinuclease ABC subunit UvrB [Polaribacter sp. IC073]|uniref:excinuclease ABC subunit UvrB n=1 Tax=Polaribacter sp. IC073 TaxID=2508540 RepID=UPI0011BFA660|nr:excinuclease ABC subunit UvrB [Polaribacter sp. IC073]TXD49442.1 excinuclease ABC subunit UvrB [Polaribacter sp. IC073]
MGQDSFILHSNYTPSGDQPEAIAKLIAGINNGATHQTLKGVTGSGKTFTMANVIHRLKRPTLILAHNKTLAAQLYSEMKAFFPENAVEYFVSYYDYYQPEVYIPGNSRFIGKNSAVNEQLERLRLSTTKSLIERKDVIVVASVSSVYGLGSPEAYRALQIPLARDTEIEKELLLERLNQLRYTEQKKGKNKKKLKRAMYQVDDHTIDVFPADAEKFAIRIEIVANTIKALYDIDPISGQVIKELDNYLISPKTLYSTPPDKLMLASEKILEELDLRVAVLNDENRFVEAARLYERTMDDVEMMQQKGYSSGIENYSSYLSDRDPKLPPTTLLDYLPKDSLLFIDESHVMIPQISAMHASDQSRKNNLIEYGFRLPSSKNNRPLSFEEFEKLKPQTIFVSATPGSYELKRSQGETINQIIRPTGLLDPEIEVRPSKNRMDDLLAEIYKRVAKDERILVMTLTKKSAEELKDFMSKKGIRVRYLHSDIKTSKRTEIIDALRTGEFDVLIGINLLREGLDIPEASLVAILDADRAGFLRSVQALIQIIGRVARNTNGKAILYADKVTNAMHQAIDESEKRREQQITYNKLHGITPKSSKRKKVFDSEELSKPKVHDALFCKNLPMLCKLIGEREKALLSFTDKDDLENIAKVRIELNNLYSQFIFMKG